jgi:hypothetical protein
MRMRASMSCSIAMLVTRFTMSPRPGASSRMRAMNAAGST